MLVAEPLTTRPFRGNARALGFFLPLPPQARADSSRPSGARRVFFSENTRTNTPSFSPKSERQHSSRVVFCSLSLLQVHRAWKPRVTNAEIDAASSCSPDKIVFHACVRQPRTLLSPPCSMFFFLRGGFGIIPGVYIDNELSKKFAAIRGRTSLQSYAYSNSSASRADTHAHTVVAFVAG